MHEINLVPEIKIKMIKTLKLRNLIFFICIVVVAASVGAAVISGSVAGAQLVAMSAKKERIEAMSAKLGEFENLSEFLTIQDQLGNIKDINANRNVLSRVFGLLNAIVPKDADKVEISELNVNLEEMTLTMEAQADAGKDPLIDYRVLESFKKGVLLAKYDYGRYVDEGGAEIPTYCIIEADADGNMYQEDGAFYALWKRNQKGCHPTAEEAEAEAEDDEDGDSDGESKSSSKNVAEDEELRMLLLDLQDELGSENVVEENTRQELELIYERLVEEYGKEYADSALEVFVLGMTYNITFDEDGATADVSFDVNEILQAWQALYEQYGDEGETFRIWRTPRFNEWYRSEEDEEAATGTNNSSNNSNSVSGSTSSNSNSSSNTSTSNIGSDLEVERPEMDLDGTIRNVAHFESECIKYEGTDVNGTVQWTSTNDCMLTEEGLTVQDSSNGKDANDNLVLRFSAKMEVDKAVFSFANKHMMVIGPEAQDVTDSYRQLQGIFAKRAEDCAEGDIECTSANTGSTSSSTSGTSSTGSANNTSGTGSARTGR